MTNKCPGCGGPDIRIRPQIGEIDTTICDPCYWRRFGSAGSEKAYFAKSPVYWHKIAEARRL